MTAVKKSQRISVEDYLDGEMVSQIKHEYMDGIVYAMAGAGLAHNIVCRPNSSTDSFQDEPVVVVEVLSESTRHIDTGEKKEAFLTIPSLAVYVLVEQGAAAVTIYRRGPEGFVQEVYEGLDANIPLGEIGIDLPLAEIYETAVFVAEVSEEEELEE